jgi:hypothetical protein
MCGERHNGFPKKEKGQGLWTQVAQKFFGKDKYSNPDYRGKYISHPGREGETGCQETGTAGQKESKKSGHCYLSLYFME